MPRDRRAVIGTAIWNEPSIRALPYAQQHAYLLAYTQPDLSRCGVLAFRPRRWAGFAKDLTVRHLKKQFDALHETRHVVLDDEHEELLIRTYVGHDGLLAQPLVVGAMVRDYQEVTSPTVRLEILRELRRIWDHTDLTDSERNGLLLLLGADPETLGIARDGKEKTRQLDRIRGVIGDGLTKPTAAAIAEGLLDPYPEGLLEGLAKGLTEGLPDPLTRGRSRMAPTPSPTPTPTPTPAPVTEGRADPLEHTDDPAGALLAEHTTAYLTPPPPAAIAGVRNAINALVAQRTDPALIRAALAKMRERQLSPRLLPELVAEVTPTHDPPRRPVASRNGQILDAAMQRAQAAEAAQPPARKAIG